jgi:two-component system NtrC family sensor kinase
MMKSLHDLRWHKTIAFKLILLIALVVSAVNGYMGWTFLSIHQKQCDETIRSTALKLSDTIKQSIRAEMLDDRRDKAYRVMKTIGGQKGIEKVRIYNPGGAIVFSTDEAEHGRMTDKTAEACNGCHGGSRPLSSLSPVDRSRIFSRGKGSRILGMINPIYNEKDCFASPCHYHPSSQRVLGVIDITLSLAEVDGQLAQARRQTILFNLLSIAVISGLAALIILWCVDRPVRDLVFGTVMVANGNLRHIIPVTYDDELGHLADSFNRMTEKLARSNDDIVEYMDILEKQFREKAQALTDAQGQLLRSEKLSVLGKMAATVAHEINNPLTGVFTYIKLMQRKLKDGKTGPEEMERFMEYLSVMSREVERTSAIVSNLLEFTRPKEPAKKRTNINGLIEESIAILHNKLSAGNVEVEKRLDSLPDIDVDPSQIKNVFINLFVNACDAMEDGGTLGIVTRHYPGDGTVRIEVSDTGKGIDPDHLPKVFDPFFTTKGKGTGLGLSVVEGIIRKHDGRIELESTVNEGTRMGIVLPVPA